MKIITHKNDVLTDKELETIKLMALGKTNTEISQIMNVATQTTNNRVSLIFKKLNANNRVFAVIKSIAKCIISLQTLIFALAINASDVDMRRGARRQSRRRNVMQTAYSIKTVSPYHIPRKYI